jgi:hypothetical protein
MDGCFSKDYAEARDKFSDAARAAGAVTSRFVLDELGPDGTDLSTDIAWLGPRTSRCVMVTISATHGVEGFFGSATQTEWLPRAKSLAIPEGQRALVFSISTQG